MTEEAWPDGSVPSFLTGGGEAGALVRATDWSATPVGPVSQWPASLCASVGILLHSRHPMFLWWGPDLVQFYNDAYIPSFGNGKHPAAMGQRGVECWQEIWPLVSPQIDAVMSRGEPSWNADHLVPIFRNGRLEDVYWTYGYSPVFDDHGGIGGTLVVCTETTGRVLGERRLRARHEFAERAALAVDAEALVAAAAEVVQEIRRDIPCAWFYAADGHGGTPRLTSTVGIHGDAAAALDVRYRPHLAAMAESGHAHALSIPAVLDAGSWAVTDVFVAHVQVTSKHPASGFVLFGLNPHQVFDDAYRHYLVEFGRDLAHAQARMAARHVLEKAQEERDALLRELERTSRAKDEFLAMLGHELRNPLSPILTALQLMRMRGERRSDREREIIERQVRHLVTLVDDLLDISRITQGKVELKRERLRVADVAAQAIEMASPLIEQRRHRLTVNIPRDLLIDADAARFAQVLANLLTNAAKYTEPGGSITMRGDAREGDARVVVQDTGVGIAPELLPNVFDAFTQERQNSARSQGGLGLGLAIVKSLVSMHGGSIAIRSQGVGHGTECVVRLPLAPDQAREMPPLVAGSTAHLSTEAREVLVVDDNTDAAQTLVEALRTLGHRVQVASDAPGALALATDYVPDVALLDLGLPVIDGCELAQRLRLQPGWRTVRLIALTGYGLDSDRERTRQAGFDAHLVKPIDLRTLNSALIQSRVPVRAD